MSQAWDRFTERMVAALRRHLRRGRGVDLPEGGAVLWRAFAELHAGRTVGMAPCPIQLAEIEAWGRLNGMPLLVRHVAVIRALDAAWLEWVASDRPKEAPSAPLTPAAFDAAF